MMRSASRLVAIVGFAWSSLVMAGAPAMYVTEDRIKVFLFGAPSFYSEVAVDLYNGTCLSLDNNLIDGRVQSILVGARDAYSVLTRRDDWTCVFWDNYDCKGNETNRLIFPDGVNNLRGAGWETKIHAVWCANLGHHGSG